jgi:hypothetical protein
VEGLVSLVSCGCENLNDVGAEEDLCMYSGLSLFRDEMNQLGITGILLPNMIIVAQCLPIRIMSSEDQTYNQNH